ncbi:MAG: hypothetical protein H7Z19_00675, partial [Chitinophagaceae bacterium]|nr:hypothetical protein [Rubrivivax sp.]
MKLQLPSFFEHLGAATVLAAMLAAPGVAGAQNIVGGSPTTAFAAVGGGVQVTADWVLSVDHLGIGVGSIYTNGFGSRVVQAVYDAPGSGSSSGAANDVTLLRLAPAAGAFVSLPVNGDLFADGTFAALAVTIVSPLNHGPARGFAYTTVDEYTTLFDPDDGGPDQPVVANYLLSHDSAVYVQSGDSGGGLFLGQVSDSTSPLLALSSAQLADASNVASGSAFVLLAAYRPWIDSTMTVDPTDGQMVQWVSAVPEPATALLWAAGLFGLGAW